MKTTKVLTTLVLLSLTLLGLGSCGSEDKNVDNEKCPNPSFNSGEYVLCLRNQETGDPIDSCVYVNTEESTPNGIYEAGTEIIAVAELPCSETRFEGWFNDITGEFVYGASHYTFSLVEDTCLHPEASFTLW